LFQVELNNRQPESHVFKYLDHRHFHVAGIGRVGNDADIASPQLGRERIPRNVTGKLDVIGNPAFICERLESPDFRPVADDEAGDIRPTKALDDVRHRFDQQVHAVLNGDHSYIADQI
jgi:hypothetical protein